MTEEEINRRIKREAGTIHSEFLQSMHNYFGLKNPPKNIPIKLNKNLEISGARLDSFDGKPNLLIYIGSSNPLYISARERIRVARLNSSHETAHYLHLKFLAERFGPVNIYNDRLNRKNELAKELVAELGTHLFFRKRAEIEEYLDITRRFNYMLNKIIYHFFGDLPIGLEESILEQISRERDISKILPILKRSGFKRIGLIKNLTRHVFYFT